MARIIIDRRKNGGKKSVSNRSKFLKRVKKQVEKAARKTVSDADTKIKDMVDGKGKKVRIAGKGLQQPDFRHNPTGGVSDRVYPGNDQFIPGDRVKRPEGGSGNGAGRGEASDTGEGSDDFEFNLTQDEFLDVFFEDLELPDLVLKDIAKIEDYTWKRAGYTSDGNPSNMNLIRTFRQSKGRKFALTGRSKQKLRELEKELEALFSEIYDLEIAGKFSESEARLKLVKDIEEQIAALKKKIKAVPFLDTTDLRYNLWEKTPNPSTQAVMFCIMDVSGSMQQKEKDLSKRFFMLLYMFLHRTYKHVEVVFIRHHTVATECSEEEFFYSKETGGTLISPALKMMKDIIEQRFSPTQWNIFGCQASDGDNWREDSHITQKLLIEDLLPICQYYAYVEVGDPYSDVSDIEPYYENVKEQCRNFEMAKVKVPADIYPVFRGLFNKDRTRK